MPRTNTDAIRELEIIAAEQAIAVQQFAKDALLAQSTDRAVAVVQERVDNTRSEVARVDKLRQEDRTALERRIDELDRKLWSLTYLLIGALISLIASLLVQVFRK